MTNYNVNDFVRLVSGISLTAAEKESLVDYLIKNAEPRKEFSGKHIAVVSFAAVLAAGAIYVLKGRKQDRFNMR